MVGGLQFQKRRNHEFIGSGKRCSVPRPHPNETKTAARTRVDKLKSALSALGESKSLEARGLLATLKGPSVQPEECQAFIKRSPNRHARLKEQRARKQQELDAAMERMAKFREEMAQAIPVAPTASDPTQQAKIPELVSELQRLKSHVAELEQEVTCKKRSRSLSKPSPDLVGGPDLSSQTWNALHGRHVGQRTRATVETLNNPKTRWPKIPTGSTH